MGTSGITLELSGGEAVRLNDVLGRCATKLENEMPITCRVCNKPNPEHIFHCAEHYKCDGCGTAEGLCTHRDRLMCAKCNDAEMARRVAAFDGDTDYTQEITCPHCGHECSDSWEMCEGPRECSDCGNSYEVERDVEVTYCTTKAA